MKKLAWIALIALVAWAGASQPSSAGLGKDQCIVCMDEGEQWACWYDWLGTGCVPPENFPMCDSAHVALCQSR
jgi:hypothetical protein